MLGSVIAALTVNTSDSRNVVIIKGQSWSNRGHFLEEHPQSICSKEEHYEKLSVSSTDLMHKIKVKCFVKVCKVKKKVTYLQYWA